MKFLILSRIIDSGAMVAGGTVQATHKKIFQQLSFLINSPDLKNQILEQGGESMLKSVELLIVNLKTGYSDIDGKFLSEEVKIFDHKWNYPFTQAFINECKKIGSLYLNEQLFDSECTSSCFDSLRLITNNKNFNSNLINEIQESYISARYLIIQSKIDYSDISEISKLSDFFDKNGNVSVLDYSLQKGLLKKGLESAYNCLDKVAKLINEYFELNLSDKKIYFESPNLWEFEGRMRDCISKTDNQYLFAIYDLHKDFSVIERIVGKYKYLADLRHCYTHYESKADYKSAVAMLKICRAIIFYLHWLLRSK